ncbi:MAG TPA: chromate efflux transporter [Candidatus Udaeobacter sp.]|nr:chromate efflux transporter [Candidatus Udaeobacter sp.]
MGSPGAGTAGRRSRLGELARLFLRLGTTAFGGPAAHIAMMDEEVVRRRGWLTREEFLDLLGATHLIPGPNSTEIAIHIGHRRAGWPGLLVAGAAFILPAALLAMALGALYRRAGALPEVQGILYGIKPVIVVVVVQALWALGRTALKSPLLVVLAAGALAASVAGIHELLLLAACGLAVAAARGIFRARLLIGLPLGQAAPTAAATAVGAWPLFLFFLKVGSVLFGSGYVLLAFLRADLVERFHWLTDAQLLDAIAVGQMTPGPVFTTATFVGYILGGPWMALVATIGIFAPAFLFVALSGPLVPRLRRSPAAGAFLDGINAGSLALMAAVTLELAPAALVDLPAIAIALVAGALLFGWRVHSGWLVLGGAVAGAVLTALR